MHLSSSCLWPSAFGCYRVVFSADIIVNISGVNSRLQDQGSPNQIYQQSIMIVGGMMYDSYSRAVLTFIIHLTWTDSDLVMYSHSTQK